MSQIYQQLMIELSSSAAIFFWFVVLFWMWKPVKKRGKSFNLVLDVKILMKKKQNCHTQTCCWQIFIIFNLNFLINFFGKLETKELVTKYLKIDTMLFWLLKKDTFSSSFSLSFSPNEYKAGLFMGLSVCVCLVAEFNFI